MGVTRREVVRSALAMGATAMIPESAGAGAATAPAARAPLVAPRSPELESLLTLEDYEREARLRMDAVAWEYVDSGAADEVTLRWNKEAFRAIGLVPRQLRDVRSVDTSVTLLGQRLAHPILLAPTACHRLAHAEGEVATARGARAAGAGMVLSSYSTVPVEQVAAVQPPLFWFQLYVQERAYTTVLIRRAVDAGATAIAVTIDTPVSGARNRQDRSGFRFPSNLPHISGGRAEHPLMWSDLDWIQRTAGVPVLLKGVMHPDDVDLGIRAGAAGIMVSNHGGRNLDTAVAAIEALPKIVDRVAGRVPVIVDGGIRRGTDVLKALAYGATAVMIGRPFVHGLAVGGAEGVQAVIGILKTELESAMMLVGANRVSALDRSILSARTAPG